MTVRRLFVALTFLDAEKSLLLEQQGLVAERLARGRPTMGDNLHMTLAFMGECTEAQGNAAREALHAATREYGRRLPGDASDGGAIRLELGRIGCFGGRRGSIVWCGPARADGSPRLTRLRGLVADEIDNRGLPNGGARFVPHVTLVRGARPLPGGDLPDICDELTSRGVDIVTRHTSVSLMWSHHPEGGSLVYTPVLTLPL